MQSDRQARQSTQRRTHWNGHGQALGLLAALFMTVAFPSLADAQSTPAPAITQPATPAAQAPLSVPQTAPQS